MTCARKLRSNILPFPHDVDFAPHLVTISLAQAAIAATHRALHCAHPVLGILASSGKLDLTDSEHFAALVLHVSDQLAEILDDYAAAVSDEHARLDALADLF